MNVALTPRDMYRLKVELGRCYGSVEDARRIMIVVLLDPNKVDLHGSVYAVWQTVLQYAQEREKLIDLLAFVASANEQPDNLIIGQLLKELREGRQSRLQSLTKAIRSRQCVLFLGPNTLRCRQGDSTPAFNSVLAREMAQDLDDCNVYFAESQRENLSYMAQRYNEMPNYVLGEQGRKALNVYKNCVIDDSVYQALAPLPWKVVINTNPDDRLAQIMNAEKPGRCQYSYYSIANQLRQSAAIQPLDDPESVLLYNIFGSFDEPTSILLSESERLSFTRKTLAKDPPLDPNVRSEFESPNYYLFLGFDFDQWYVKIIFDTILKLTRQQDRSFSVFPKGVVLNESNREFFEEEFKIYFVSDDMDSYLKDIITHYNAFSPALP
ncbi:SIR2 family protein [Spirosoma koreense]